MQLLETIESMNVCCAVIQQDQKIQYFLEIRLTSFFGDVQATNSKFFCLSILFQDLIITLNIIRFFKAHSCKNFVSDEKKRDQNLYFNLLVHPLKDSFCVSIIQSNPIIIRLSYHIVDNKVLFFLVANGNKITMVTLTTFQSCVVVSQSVKSKSVCQLVSVFVSI